MQELPAHEGFCGLHSCIDVPDSHPRTWRSLLGRHAWLWWDWIHLGPQVNCYIRI